MKRLVNISAVLLFALLASCGDNEKKETQTHEAAKVDSLKLMAVSARCMAERVQLPGTIEPFEFVQIFPKVNGFVKAVYVDRGTSVKRDAADDVGCTGANGAHGRGQTKIY
jgi:membrane fusion protein (multidrug efflux system)